MTIALAMIVKDEAATLPRLLASLTGHVDSYIIIDTGSTDDTQQALYEWADRSGVEGNYLKRPWVNFGVNRSELIDVARNHPDIDYLLLADADYEYEIEPGALDNLTADAYRITVAGPDIDYGEVGLVSAALPWHYVGVTHEYIAPQEGRTIEKLPGVTITHHHDGGSRGDKFERDLELLTREAAEHPDNARTHFYLAQTLRDIGRNEDAALMYRHRARMGGWDEEVYYSLLQAGILEDSVPALLKAWDFRPQRLEALYEAAWRLRRDGKYEAAYMVTSLAPNRPPVPDDYLFVGTWVWEWGLLFEHSIAAYYVGDHAVFWRSSDKLLAQESLPEPYRERVKSNLLTA